MLLNLIKRKNKSNGDITTNPLPATPTYKNLDFHSSNTDGVHKFKLSMTDGTGHSPHGLIIFTFKISKDISFSKKKIIIATNQVDYSHFELIPCSGIEKVSVEFKLNQINHFYDFSFCFKFRNQNLNLNSDSNQKHIIFFSGFIYNIDYPKGIEEMLYQIQNAMQAAIEKY
ncbi:hypothetical protein [Bacillus thuringiensis]|uniref:Uncharacterized protein n=1 Tax=Bacillus thuringiensis subsp. jegathesan TaxID=56955 RepID=A0A9X6LWW9_BACTJ|nr:hypothetical protein [Bacillus thuringiensis]OUB59037.1 hypothetical protein BK750_28705 [Bacillus thuringiensis serovar jegathesan]